MKITTIKVGWYQVQLRVDLSYNTVRVCVRTCQQKERRKKNINMQDKNCRFANIVILPFFLPILIESNIK